MVAHLVETTLEKDGSLSLTDLPMRAGDKVEVIIVVRKAADATPASQERYPLRGKQPYEFDDPFSPAVPEEEWDALR